MGLLSAGVPLDWEDMAQWQDHVRKYGVQQFIKLYNRLKDEKGRVLKWGDEVEYIIVKLDHAARQTRVSLRAEELLGVLTRPETLKQEEEERTGRASSRQLASVWRPEYGAYMVEGTPGSPYGGGMSFFNTVEHNMRMRRQEVEGHLAADEICVSLSTYPRLGCPDFTYPPAAPNPLSPDSITQSLFWPTEAIFLGHPRFARLSANIRQRRGEKVAINVPIFKDELTPSPFVEDFSQLGDDGSSAAAALPDHVYMDAMGFGMGLCCLQVTFQADNISEARDLYDQLAPLCPILLALTAASPAHRGYLVDTDCRWNIISAAVDDRTREERGLEPLKTNKFVIPKSRYDSIDSYLSANSKKWEGYNDIQIICDEEIYRSLVEGGVDELMAKHVAHLFIRDSVSLFREKIREGGDYEDNDTDHFENIQSTNWQTMRFKPPPPGDTIGWRVEFRPCELQISDFENAAVVCFVVLLTRAILSYKWNLLMPISLVDENMKRAQKRDAVLNQKFYWRKDIFTASDKTQEPHIEEMSVDEIFNGIPGSDYQGLIALVREYLRGQDDVEADTMCTLSNYWQLLSQRASGRLMTNARWIRQFIRAHPEYRKDSRVPEGTLYDLMVAIDQIQRGERKEPALFVRAEKVSRTADIAATSSSSSSAGSAASP